MLCLAAFCVYVLATVSASSAVETKLLLPNEVESRITNGHEPLDNQFPYHAEILYKINGLYRTRGGTIISYRYILTMAQLFVMEKKKIESVTVNVGRDSTKQTFNIAFGKITYHEDFQEEPLRNDIAVMETPTPIAFSDNVQSAKLPHFVNKASSFIGRNGHTIGLHFISGGDFNKDVKRLMYANMVILPGINCEMYEGFYEEEFICARSKEGTRITMKDEGGALTLATPLKKQRTIVGILTQSPPAEANLHSIYTRVSFFAEWIKEKAHI